MAAKTPGREQGVPTGGAHPAAQRGGGGRDGGTEHPVVVLGWGRVPGAAPR